MKNKKLSFFMFLPLISTILASCGNANNIEESSGITYVHVLNAEDYIDETLLDDFEDYIYQRDGKRVQIIYDTYDTNETMYNTIQTGKTSYDLICASDYMVQRLANEDYLHPINHDDLPYYKSFVSKFLSNDDPSSPGKLNFLKVNNKDGSFELDDYSAGYMWGTLGVLYNPEYILPYNSSSFDNDPEWKGLSHDERINKIIDIFDSNDGYSFLWNSLLNQTISIKDSMRDTYALGNFEVFKDYYLKEEDYNKRNKKFNDSSNDTIEVIKNKLIDLKSNIFGFEVDSGKNDIVTQKIGVNLAWSGDAVNSINRGYYADNDWTIPREEPVDLYYSIPSLGANVWMDIWATPLSKEEGYYESDTYKYTLEFLDYLNKPENAIRNVYYNGYTSFITSGLDDNYDEEEAKSMLAYMLYSYDLSGGDEDLDYESYDLYDVTPFFNFDEEFSVNTSYVSGDILEEDVDDRTFTFKKDENGIVKIIIRTDLSSFEGRLLKAQYPEADDISNLYVMNDYGDQNDKIVQMWEDVKVNPLPLWITVTLIVFLVLFIGYLGSYKLLRILKLKKRKIMREELKQ